MAFKNLKELSFEKSNYIKPKRFAYESNGRLCTWDFIDLKIVFQCFCIIKN